MAEFNPRENWARRFEALQEMIDTDEISDESHDFNKKIHAFLDENDPTTIMEVQFIAIRLATILNNDPKGFAKLLEVAKVIAFRNREGPLQSSGDDKK